MQKTPEKDKISLLRLTGRWQANESNELNFLVRADRQEEVLRFRGAWRVNRNQEIIYTYKKQNLVRKARGRELLTFKGFWQINGKDNISYILDLENASLLEFKVQMQRPDLKGDRREIKYRVGIGARELKKERVFSLFGSWKIEPRKSISFQLDCGQSRVRAIIFSANVFLNDNNELIFELKDRKGKPLGISVAFERSFFKKKALLFARLFDSEDARRLEGGIKIPW
jgi:hypothetical protein